MQHSSLHRYASGGSRSRPITSLARTTTDTHVHIRKEHIAMYMETHPLLPDRSFNALLSVNEVLDRSPSRVILYPPLIAINLNL